MGGPVALSHRCDDAERAQDPIAARKAFAKGAATGDAHAQRSLGVLVYLGIGGQVDLFHARKLFERAAMGDSDDPIAHNNLAVMCLHGLGGDVDEPKARAHLLRAAERLSYKPGQKMAGNDLDDDDILEACKIGGFETNEMVPPLGLRNIAIMYFTGEPAEVSSDNHELSQIDLASLDEGDAPASNTIPGESGHFALARRYFAKCAVLRDPVSEFYLGHMCEHGLGGAIDLVQARAWYTLAASHQAEATGKRSANDDDDDEGQQDIWSESETSADELMVRGNTRRFTRAGIDAAYLAMSRDDVSDVRGAVLEARASLGSFFYAGKGGYGDKRQARVWLSRAASMGHAEAELALGNMMRLGEGGPADAAQARALYIRAANRGLVAAQSNAAQMLHEGEGGPVDLEGARNYYRMAAQNGDSVAMLSLGTLTVEMAASSPTPMSANDAKEAVEWFTQSAERGDTVAQINLGMMYLNGDHGLSKNVTQAKSWFSKAAKTGDPTALNHLATCLLLSNKPADRRRAMLLLARAAAAGHPEAQATLGYMLWNDNKPEDARNWLSKAAAQGAASAYWATPSDAPPLWYRRHPHQILTLKVWVRPRDRRQSWRR